MHSDYDLYRKRGKARTYRVRIILIIETSVSIITASHPTFNQRKDGSRSSTNYSCALVTNIRFSSLCNIERQQSHHHLRLHIPIHRWRMLQLLSTHPPPPPAPPKIKYPQTTMNNIIAVDPLTISSGQQRRTLHQCVLSLPPSLPSSLPPFIPPFLPPSLHPSLPHPTHSPIPKVI